MSLGFAAPWPWLTAFGVSALGLLIWAWRLEAGLGRAAWRRWALVVVASCLFLLAAGPSRRQPAVAGSAVILTSGASAADVERIGPAAARVALAGASAGLGEEIVDLPEFVRRRPELRRWLVAGVGLAPWDLAALPGDVEFAAPAEPGPGVDRAAWRRNIELGEIFEVRGSAVVPAGGNVTVRLVGPAGLEDSRDLAESGGFVLAAVPRQEGRFLYRLELDDGVGDPQAMEVDVEVAARRLPRILWLEDAPGFESREVKTWLRDLGGALTLRTRISRGRFRYEYLNQEHVEVARLARDVLSELDLLVIDGPAWVGLAPSEREVLSEAVEEGLGLLLLPALPSLSGRAAPPGGFEVEDVGDLEEIDVEGRGPGLSTLAVLTIPARQFAAGGEQRTLLADGAGRPLAVGRALGLGRVAATVVEGTYRWPLRGESDSHRRYWSHLLAAVARAPSSGARVPVGPLLIDRPLEIEVVSGEAPELTVSGPDGATEALAPIQDPLDPRRWHTLLWPRTSGWHRLAWGGETTSFHVAPATGWRSWRERQAHDATARRAALAMPAGLPGPAERVARPLARWPLFGLLLLALAPVWADEQWRRSTVGS